MRKRILIACFLAPSILYGQVAGPGLKPGLWEVRVIRQVVDGRDISAQLSQASRQMQQAMENMPPEQRARMEGMMKQHGARWAANGAYEICMTPAMAKSEAPIISKEGRCRTSKVVRNGNRTSFAFTCKDREVTTTGTGSAEITSDRVTTRTDATSESVTGEKHTVRVESEMRYVKADCGDVKPPAEDR